MDKMLEALRTLKEECQITKCKNCSISEVCDDCFNRLPADWSTPEHKEVEEPNEETEDEEIFISVHRKKLEQLLDFIDNLTWKDTDGCNDCPTGSCNGACSCPVTLLEWLQDYPIL